MVVTHPSCVGGPSRAEEAAGFLASLVSTGGARILGAEASLGSRLVRAALERRIAGPRIFDLQIALIGLDAGADTIWTHDAGFASLPGLAVVDPLKG